MEKKNAYQNKWIAENYDVFKMKMPKGEKEKLKKLAQKEGFKSVSEYLRSLYKDKIQDTQGGVFEKLRAIIWPALTGRRIIATNKTHQGISNPPRSNGKQSYHK